MLVADLIKELKKYPRNAMVLVNGYEVGYQDPHDIGIHKVYVDPSLDDCDYFGKYMKENPQTNDGILAVIIER